MERNGIDFFPYPASNPDALDFVEAKFRLRGIGVYIKILQKIFDKNGYYADMSDDAILLFNKQIGVNDSIVPDVIKECIKRGIFDKEMYEKYRIVTSEEKQKEYLIATRKRKDIKMKDEYLYAYTDGSGYKININKI